MCAAADERAKGRAEGLGWADGSGKSKDDNGLKNGRRRGHVLEISLHHHSS